MNDKDAPVIEIAVRKVKDGMKEDFIARRTDFITVLKAQDGVSNDREFQSFYSLPEPDQQEVFIGMTQYATGKTVGKMQGKVLSKFMKFAKTMDLKAYVFVQPAAGGAFDLGTLAAKPGQVLELAVRRVKPGQEDAFQSSRKAFVTWLGGQAGVAGSWEFKVVGGKDTEGLTVGMSVYESQEAFQAIAGQVQSLPEAGAYFSTFEPVALQYAVSANTQ
ncbi:MAG: hypothetical protein NW241_12245 [Bacteroidia bacterium]|nr:hypothetical protein [Bacteroidia bacterium]